MGNGTRLRTSVHGDEFACGAQQESPKGGGAGPQGSSKMFQGVSYEFPKFPKFPTKEFF